MAIQLINPNNLVFGVEEPKPTQGFPPGRIKIRMRGNEFARAYVKTETGIREFFIVDNGDHWKPFAETQRNERQ